MRVFLFELLCARRRRGFRVASRSAQPRLRDHRFVDWSDVQVGHQQQRHRERDLSPAHHLREIRRRQCRARCGPRRAIRQRMIRFVRFVCRLVFFVYLRVVRFVSRIQTTSHFSVVFRFSICIITSTPLSLRGPRRACLAAQCMNRFETCSRSMGSTGACLHDQHALTARCFCSRSSFETTAPGCTAALRVACCCRFGILNLCLSVSFVMLVSMLNVSSAQWSNSKSRCSIRRPDSVARTTC